MNQLIVFFGGIGDTVLFAPSVKQLSKRGDITFVGYPERIVLLKEMSWVKRVYSPEQVEFESIFSTPKEKLIEFLSTFDIAYLFLRQTGKATEVVKQCGIKEVITAPGIPPEDWKSHASEYYLSLLGLEREEEEFLLPILPSEQHNKVVIHPGSGSQKKNFPLDFFAELTIHFQLKGREVAWCVGPAENWIKPPKGVEKLDSLPLVELARFLRGASLYIGNDSGISHIAGALGIPTIVLFKSTNPNVWKPLGPQVFTFLEEPNLFKNFICKCEDILSNLSN
ncbi:MAG: glycosyltransferase family 9 protein [Candidatus Hydrogenedentes bacterium]|nr:glycosyltransferase family 9 protein [Candidatus Hydrogenedentota bacterium]